MTRNPISLPFAWATDIHLDSARSTLPMFLDTVKRAPEDSLLVTGDIASALNVAGFLKKLAETGKTIYFVLGNHDFYHGAIADVKGAMVRLGSGAASGNPNAGSLVYLNAFGPIVLDYDTYLVGVDGYADGIAGDLDHSQVWLNDYELCETFFQRNVARDRVALRTLLGELGYESARKLKDKLALVPRYVTTLYVATHAPPFTVAHFAPNGKPGDAHWSPHFVNTQLGDVILLDALDHPHRQYIVLCGHTHTGARVEVTPNITVLVGWATYGEPILQSVAELPDRTVRRPASINL